MLQAVYKAWQEAKEPGEAYNHQPRMERRFQIPGACPTAAIPKWGTEGLGSLIRQ